MAWRFWLAALVFHAIVGGVVIALIRRRFARSKAGDGGLRTRDLVTDTALFGMALPVAAAVAGSLAPYPFFAVARFLCQGVFGEGVLLTLSLSILAARRGCPVCPGD